MTDAYRFCNNSVYEYNREQNAYIFIGKLNGRTEEQFIQEYEEYKLFWEIDNANSI